MQYIYNDPSTPQLIAPYTLPVAPGVMPFKVDGFRGDTDAIGTLEHQAACGFITVTNAINLANHYLMIPINRWAMTQTLFVQPRAGKQLNAFYDRAALRFFYTMDPITNALVYTSNSFDVVAHECGHAILDALRPDLYNVQSMEIWAFHESWGDIHAIINMLQHDIILDFVLQETNNDLRRENCVSKIGEEMGTALYHITGGRMGTQLGVLRNAVNTFVYKQPELLPKNGLDNQLTSEPHNFSRVFTGAWYDILVGIYEQLKTTLSPKQALIAARDTLATYTYRCLRMAAATVRFYDSVARSMLVVDKANGYRYNDLMNQVFISRGILHDTVRPMVSTDWMAFQNQIDAADEVMQDSAVTAVRNKSISVLPMPKYMINVEAPADTYYEFNGDGQCVNVITNSAEELIDHAHVCIEFLKENDLIRADKQTPFEIDADSNLIRSHFACFSNNCMNNCRNPQEPEYRKCWKPANNAGCSCGKNHKHDHDEDGDFCDRKSKIVVQRNVRSH